MEMKGFPDRANDVYGEMVGAAISLAPDKSKLEKVFVFGVIWESSYQGACLYGIQGEVLEAREASFALGCDQSTYRGQIRSILLDLCDYLEELQTIFKDAEQESPQCVKISYDVASGSADFDLIYEPVTSEEKGFGEAVEEWRTELNACKQ
jgi:hypothetical protein